MWSYRRMLRISWTKKVSNKEVLQLIHAKKTKKLKYFGHMIRQDKIQRALLEGKINAKRGRGRPRVNWTMNINDWSGKSYAAAVRTNSTTERRLANHCIQPSNAGRNLMMMMNCKTIYNIRLCFINRKRVYHKLVIYNRHYSFYMPIIDLTQLFECMFL